MSTPKPGRNTDQNSLQNTNNPASATPDQGRSAFSESTTRKNTDTEEGSSQLGGEAYKQGEVGKAADAESEKSSLNTEQQLSGTKQGSDASREQKGVDHEREDVNSERDQEQPDIERTPLDPDQHKTHGNEPGKPNE